MVTATPSAPAPAPSATAPQAPSRGPADAHAAAMWLEKDGKVHRLSVSGTKPTADIIGTWQCQTQGQLHHIRAKTVTGTWSAILPWQPKGPTILFKNRASRTTT